MYDNTSNETLATRSFIRALHLQRLERVGGLTPVPQPWVQRPSPNDPDGFIAWSEANDT